MKKKEIHFMLDLETLSTKPNAHILELALVCFDPFTGKVDSLWTTHATFGGMCSQVGSDISDDTLAWWLEQDTKLADLYYDGTKQYDSLPDTLETIREILVGLRKQFKVRVWCTGSFDIDIVNNAAVRFLGEKNIITPFEARDVRTVRQLASDFNLPSVELEYEHTAYNDCLRQIRYVTDVYGALSERTTAHVGDKGGRVDVPAPTE